MQINEDVSFQQLASGIPPQISDGVVSLFMSLAATTPVQFEFLLHFLSLTCNLT